MERIAPPTHADLTRIAADPVFAQEAIARWGIDALMDPECENCPHDPPVPCDHCGQHRVGLGDVIAKVTKLFGVKPCSACERRRRTMNRIRIR